MCGSRPTSSQARRLLDLRPRVDEAVDHHVADEVDARRRHVLPQQVRRGALFRREEHVGDRIGQHAIDLFGHGPVAAAQPRLDVRQQRPRAVGILQLCRGQRARQRRVDVADDDNGRRLMLEQGRLEPLQHAPGLRAVRPRADGQGDVRPGQAQLPEEDVRHRLVVVLAGMDDLRVEIRHRAQTLEERRDLHEVGPRAGHEEHTAHREGLWGPVARPLA